MYQTGSAIRHIVAHSFFSTTASLANATRKFRLDTISKLGHMPRYGPRQLEDTLADFVRKGDLLLGASLLRLGQKELDFDPKQELAAYLIIELVDTNNDGNLARAAELVAEMQQPTDLVLQVIFDKTVESAADNIMDRLWPILIARGFMNAIRLEVVLLGIYLRSLRMDAVLTTLHHAQTNKMPIQTTAWREILEVVLQPETCERLVLTQVAERVTDRRFDKLQVFLDQLRRHDVKLDEDAINALDAVMATTVVPNSFIKYLEEYVSSKQ
jgi:hypothetical protein